VRSQIRCQPCRCFVIKQVLLEPKLEHPQRVESGDRGNRQEIPGQVLAGIPSAQPQPRRAHAGTLPSDGLFQIHLGTKIRKPGVNRAGFQTAGRVPPNLHGVAAKNLNPLVGEQRSCSQPISGDLISLRNRLGLRVVRLLGPDRSRRKNQGDRERENAVRSRVGCFHR